MDTQTHNMRFESMRKQRGALPGNTSRSNKQLVMAHKDLTRRCDSMIKKHANDTRHFTAFLRHQQHFVERRQEYLSKQKDKFKLESRQTQALLDSYHRYHLHRERTFQQEIEVSKRKVDNIDIAKEIMKLAMPTHMKQRMAKATFHVRCDITDNMK